MAHNKEINGLMGVGEEMHNVTEQPPADSASNHGEVEPLQLEHDQRLSAQKTSEGLKVIIVSSITFAVGVTVALIVTIYCGAPEVPPHGSVACEIPECSVVGTDILKKGGSAVDAAIATTLCVGVSNPIHAGIGGGAFMLIRQHKEKLSEAIDGREVAPLAARPNMYNKSEDAQKSGPLSIGVPGELKALALAHQRHGKLPWSDVVMPAVKIAREGFRVTRKIAKTLQEDENINGGNQLFQEFFYPGGVALRENATVTNPALADTLEKIATEGVDAFYKGQIGKDLVGELVDTILSSEDLTTYEALIRDPITSTFFNHSIESFPAPGGGPILLLLLNIMEGFLMKTNETAEINNNITAHRLIEAIKFSYAQRSQLEDPLFNADMLNISSNIASKEFADRLRSNIDDDQTHELAWYTGTNVANTQEARYTAQISVIGPDEDLVSVTSSLNSLFGSKVMTSSGILLNNQMLDFDLPRAGESGQLNLVAPGKRPLSAMSPTVVHSRDRPCGMRVAIGGTNGTRIISGIGEVLIRLLAYGDTLENSILASRLHDPLEDSDVIEYESSYDPAVLSFLEEKGHTEFREMPDGINIVHAVAKLNETIWGASDPRLIGAESSTY